MPETLTLPELTVVRTTLLRCEVRSDDDTATKESNCLKSSTR